MSKLKLPFAVSPKETVVKVGDEEVGILEIPVIGGGLSVGEQRFVDENLAMIPDNYVVASQLATRIDAERKLDDLVFALDIIINTPRYWEEQQRDEISELQTSGKIDETEAAKRLAEVERKAKIMADCRIRYAEDLNRINMEADKKLRTKQLDTVTAILRRLNPDWNQEATLTLSEGLFQKIWDFFQNDQGTDPELEPQVPTEEDVVKPPEATPSPTDQPTGGDSIGSSSTTGPTIPDSVPSALLANPVG